MWAKYSNIKQALEQQIKLSGWKTKVFFGLNFKDVLNLAVVKDKSLIVCITDELIDDFNDTFESEYIATITMFMNSGGVTDEEATQLKEALKNKNFMVNEKHSSIKYERGRFIAYEGNETSYELDVKIIIA